MRENNPRERKMIMKRTDGWLFFLLACASPWAMAQKAEGRTPSGNPDALLVLPISAPEEEHRGAAGLRDVLRQPYEVTQELGSRPYRLSPEERQRLREQLRSQPDGVVLKGKP